MSGTVTVGERLDRARRLRGAFGPARRSDRIVRVLAKAIAIAVRLLVAAAVGVLVTADVGIRTFESAVSGLRTWHTRQIEWISAAATRHTLRQISSDFAAARREMNRLAEVPWRNLPD